MLKQIKPIIKNTAIYAMGNISGKLVGFILLPYYTEKLSVAEYGIFGTIDATFQLIVAIAGLNLTVAFVRWYWDKDIHARQKSIYFTTLTFVSCIALLVFIGFYPISHAVSNLLFNTDDYSRLVRLMALAASLEIICVVPASLCKVQSKAALYTRNLIIRLFIVLTCTLFTVVFLNRKVEGIYEAQIAGSIVYLLLFVPLTLKNCALKFEYDILKKMLNYSFPIVISSAFNVILVVTDRYTLNFIAGQESVGIYSLAHKFANLLKIVIVISVQSALLPVIFKMVNDPGVKRFLSNTMTYFTLGLMFFVIGLSLFGQEIIKLLSRNPEFWDSWKIIPILSFAVVFSMMKDNAVYCLQIVKRTKMIAGITMFVMLLNIALNILLVPMMGSVGAALSTLFAQIIFFAAMLYFSNRYYPVDYEYRKIVVAIGAGLLICIAPFIICDWSLTWRLCIKTALLASYPVILYLLFFNDSTLSLNSYFTNYRQNLP